MNSSSHSSWVDAPFSAVLFRYLWPFWLFQDASRGDRLARAAAYRHNRSMRTYLPAYLLRWMLSGALALGLTHACESAGLPVQSAGPGNVFLLLTVLTSLLFAGSVCMLALIGYIYVYLGKHES